MPGSFGGAPVVPGAGGAPVNPGAGGIAGPGAGGAPSPGAGGTPGAGAPMTGTGGAVTACMPGDTTNLVNKEAWVCLGTTDLKLQGAWYGYGDGTTCMPEKNICSTGKCCITGKTQDPDPAMDMKYPNWGCGLALELNSTGGDAPVKTAYSGPVKCFDIELTGSSGKNPVRIGFTQASVTTGKVSPFNEIPAFTDGWKGQMCFTDVNCPMWATAAQCEKPNNMPGTPHDLQIQVTAAAAATASDFNVCVSKFTPVTTTDPGGTTNSCPTVTGNGTITDKYGSQHVTCSGKDYIVQNNVWGSGATQTITYGPGTKFKVTAQAGAGQNGAPASYPSIFVGAYDNRSTAGSGLPKAVSSIAKDTLATSWTWSDTGVTGSYNAAYDVWFSTTAAGDPTTSVPSGGYLMVWYHDPPDNQPIGMQLTQNGTATIGGRNWTVWYGTNSGSGKPCVSYVAQQKVNSFSFKLGDFIQDAVTRGYVQNSWYLSTVFSGFEIWSGGVGLETKDFAIGP